MAGLDATTLVVSAAVVAVVTAAAVGAAARARRQRQAGRRAPASWTTTKGTVLSSTVQVGRRAGDALETPLVLYAYQVGNRVFRGSTVRCGRGEANAARTAARYPAGTSVVVSYDPADPSKSTLER
ncbi:MAG: DUF3592 domain-containing protein [Ilumatobacteraceae bacterium]